METAQIEFEPFIGEAARQFIVNGLDMHNIAATGLPDYCPVNFVLRGGRGDVLGGVLGLLWGGWLQVTCLWVAEAARGAGHGTRLLENAEAYARSRGAVGERSRPTASRPGHFTNGSATRYSARSTGILPGTSSSSCGKPLRRATPANSRAEPPAFRLPSGHARAAIKVRFRG